MTHRIPRATRRALACAVAMALFAGAAGAAQIRGRIVNNDTGRPAAGAQVVIPGTTSRAVADSEGRFTLSNVAAGPHTLVITGAGFREQRLEAQATDAGAVIELAVRSVEQGERIVVSGIRAADMAAVAAKREADTQVEVVTADEVGKLVDRNVAEAVGRLPGVSVSTDKGEARYVVIRGLEPTLANVTINNQTSAAPEPESRQVKLDDVPAALIGEVTVVKVLTADRDANAIAGQVNIKTLSAFDRGRTFGSLRGAGTWGDLYDDKGWEGDLIAGTVFGDRKQFGAVVSYSKSRRQSFSDDIIATGDVAWQVINGFDVPVSLDARVYQPAWRTREGIVANFDWDVNANARAYVRLTDSKFDDDEQRNRFRFLFPTAASGYSNLSAAGGTIVGAREERYIRIRREITESKTATAGGDFKFGQDTLTVEGSFTKATKEDPVRSEFRYRTGTTTVPGVYVLADRMFDLTRGAQAVDPTRFNLNTFRDQHRTAFEDLWQVRADYQIARPSWGPEGYMKFGAKMIDRHKVNDPSGNSWTYTGPNRSLANATTRYIDTVFDGRYVFGPAVDFDASRAFFAANPGLFTLDPGGTLSDSLATDYDVNERISAAYGMASFNVGNLVITPGVRVEQTKADFKAKAVTATSTVDQGYNSFGSRNYTDVFPSIAGKMNFSRELVGRASVTTAIGRPDYDKVVPTVSVDQAANSVTQGNPGLEPLKAVNVDASLEYYMRGGGLVAGAVFYKDIDNPIFISTQTVPGTGIYGGVTLTNAIVTQPRNGDRSKLTGFEFNVVQPFTFLPSPWDGFGMSLNVTLVTGDTRVPGRSDKLPLVQQSKRLGNLQAYYEKYGFAARVVYNYRSPVLEIVGVNTSNDIYVDTNRTLGAKVSYEVIKNLQVFLEATNLTDEPDYRYAATTSRLVETEKFGRAFRAGLTYSF
jgi:TonB-dependent receptor